MTGIIIPSSESDKQKIKDAMKEISNAMTRIDAEKEFIKEAIDELADSVQIPKKYLNKMARIHHKQNLYEVSTEMDDIETLYESTMT
jgi:uncharacterized protein (DUF342 family)